MHKTNFTPLGDRVLVSPDSPEERTAMGLWIPDMSKDRPQIGTVIAVGPGKWVPEINDYKPIGINKGDRILYGKFAGTDIELDGDGYLIISEQDVMGLVSVSVVDEELQPMEDVDGEAVHTDGDPATV